MLSIKGICDGKNIKPLEPIPINRSVDVIITFLETVEVKTKKKNWRSLRGSAKGEGLMSALLISREEDLGCEK